MKAEMADSPATASRQGDLLRQLARATTGHVRRVVLMDPQETVIASFNDVLVRLSCQPKPAQRPRLRDGRWLL